MTLGLIFWILMLLWVALSSWTYWPQPSGSPQPPQWLPSLFLFVLLLLLGWGVFGAPIRG